MLHRRSPEHYGKALIEIEFDETLDTSAGISFGTQFRPCELDAVLLDGKELPASHTDGYHTWTDLCSRYVTVNVPTLEPGEHRVEIRYH